MKILKGILIFILVLFLALVIGYMFFVGTQI